MNQVLSWIPTTNFGRELNRILESHNLSLTQILEFVGARTEVTEQIRVLCTSPGSARALDGLSNQSLGKITEGLEQMAQLEGRAVIVVQSALQDALARDRQAALQNK